jgi:hypothetical protein
LSIDEVVTSGTTVSAGRDSSTPPPGWSWRYGLVALILATSIAVGLVSPVLVLPYLALMAGLLLLPSRSSADQVTLAGPHDHRSRPRAEPFHGDPQDESTFETADRMSGADIRGNSDQVSETPKTRRGRARSKNKTEVVATPTVSAATWVRVGPGRFVRTEGGQPEHSVSDVPIDDDPARPGHSSWQTEATLEATYRESVDVFPSCGRQELDARASLEVEREETIEVDTRGLARAEKEQPPDQSLGLWMTSTELDSVSPDPSDGTSDSTGPGTATSEADEPATIESNFLSPTGFERDDRGDSERRTADAIIVLPSAPRAIETNEVINISRHDDFVEPSSAGEAAGCVELRSDGPNFEESDGCSESTPEQILEDAHLRAESAPADSTERVTSPMESRGALEQPQVIGSGTTESPRTDDAYGSSAETDEGDTSDLGDVEPTEPGWDDPSREDDPTTEWARYRLWPRVQPWTRRGAQAFCRGRNRLFFRTTTQVWPGRGSSGGARAFVRRFGRLSAPRVRRPS